MRRPSEIIVVASLALLAAAVTLWIASYLTPMWLGYSERRPPTATDPNGKRWEVDAFRITAARGRLGLVNYGLLIDSQQEVVSSWRFSVSATDEFGIRVPTGSQEIGMSVSPGWQMGDFEFFHDWWTIIMLPIWALVLLFSIAPLRWIALRVRKRRRVIQSLCPLCGYDLRATPARCPECGAVPPKLAAEQVKS